MSIISHFTEFFFSSLFTFTLFFLPLFIFHFLQCGYFLIPHIFFFCSFDLTRPRLIPTSVLFDVHLLSFGLCLSMFIRSLLRLFVFCTCRHRWHTPECLSSTPISTVSCLWVSFCTISWCHLYIFFLALCVLLLFFSRFRILPSFFVSHGVNLINPWMKSCLHYYDRHHHHHIAWYRPLHLDGLAQLHQSIGMIYVIRCDFVMKWERKVTAGTSISLAKDRVFHLHCLDF